MPSATAEPGPAEPALRAVLAQKLLHAWAQNQHQVLVPLALNLGRLEPGPRALLVQVMAGALAACGASAGPERLRLVSALARIGGAEETGAAEAALARPPHLLDLLAELEEAGLAAHGYAAAASVLDQRVAVERAFLGWLAARFALPPSLVSGLARRYRR
ncbi:DUF533 domain-containing protein [Falsiroseomonas sp.]|uniref:DUF533 domain-containing protein n=1 Tax=Falsiroseomonas sp. TaxID=2870721 RepID=UPI003562E98C